MTTENEAKHDETVIGTAEDSGDGEHEFHPFDEVSESYSPSVIRKVTAADGLPTQAVQNADATDIPELSPETLVCMGDYSEFYGDKIVVVPACTEERDDVLYLKGSDLQVVKSEIGLILKDNTFRPDQVERVIWRSEPSGNSAIVEWELKWPISTSGHRPRLEPKRHACSHYVRQVTQLDMNPKNKVHFRLCAARRTTEGTFMTVRDIAMWACSMREPRDLASEAKYIDSFDEQKMKEGRNRVYASIFGNPEKVKD